MDNQVWNGWDELVGPGLREGEPTRAKKRGITYAPASLATVGNCYIRLMLWYSFVFLDGGDLEDNAG